MALTADQGTVGRAPSLRSTAWLDLVRVVAIVAVVGIHALAPVIGTGTAERGSVTWWSTNVVNASLRWCVPVFVMVSGALLLDPAKAMTTRGFYQRRLRRLAVPIVAWTAVYLAFRSVYDTSGVSPGQATQEVLAGSPFLQLYFLFVIAGLYVLTPYLRVLTLHAPRRMLAGFAAVMLALGAADQAIATLGGVGEPNAVTRFLPYVGYFVAGWLLRGVRPGFALLRTATLAFVLGWAGIALTAGAATEVTGWNQYGQYVYGFLSPLVVLQSLGAFVLLRAAGDALVRRWGDPVVPVLSRLAAVTFGVFLLHPAVLFPLRRWTGIPEDALPVLGAALGWTAAATLGSALVTEALRRTRYLRALV